MKVFLDECVDWRLSRDLTGHDVKTAAQMGWTAIKNGDLLALVAQQFDVFVTVDRNLSFQQNIALLPLAVIVFASAAESVVRPPRARPWPTIGHRRRCSRHSHDRGYFAVSRSPRLKGPTLILAVVGILAWVFEHYALAARTELLSIKGFPIGKNQYVDQSEIQTWGVKVWAMCHLPTPGWRITAGSDGTLGGILAGKRVGSFRRLDYRPRNCITSTIFF